MRASGEAISVPPARGLRRAGRATAALALGLALLGAAGCKPTYDASDPRIPAEHAVPAYLSDTVGSIARFTGRDPIPVQGYGFVIGLDGTGTTVVPPGIRQEILFMMNRHHVDDAEAILQSRDTAVVTVGGAILPGCGKGETFDLEVRALANTETSSLAGGTLLECDLTQVAIGRSGPLRSEVLALGRGSIFVSPFKGHGGGTGDPRVGRVLAGGRATRARVFKLVLLDPSIRTVDQVVRIINTRFPDAAKGRMDVGINLVVPNRFRREKTRFLDLVGALYLRETPGQRDARVEMLLRHLAEGRDLERVALYLEAFGEGIVPRLAELADTADPTTRFYVGRTLGRLGDARAVHLLEPIALDDASPYQEDAVWALGEVRSGLGLGVLGRALNAASPRVRIAAWQATEKIAPGSALARVFEDKFKLSVVPTDAEPFVYVARTLEPHIALFGRIDVRPPVLADTRRVTASAPPGAGAVTLITRRRDRDLRVETRPRVRDIVEACAAPLYADEDTREITGLDLSYSDIVGLLDEMARRKGLAGPIVLQPLTYETPGGVAPRPITLDLEPAADAPPEER